MSDNKRTSRRNGEATAAIDGAATAPAIITAAAIAGAARRMKVVNSLAEVLADEMQKIHGGEWRVQIDHECGFVVIRPLNDRSIQKPQRGEVV